MDWVPFTGAMSPLRRVPPQRPWRKRQVPSASSPQQLATLIAAARRVAEGRAANGRKRGSEAGEAQGPKAEDSEPSYRQHAEQNLISFLEDFMGQEQDCLLYILFTMGLFYPTQVGREPKGVYISSLSIACMTWISSFDL